MAVKQPRNVAYSLGQPLSNLSPFPITAQRAPTVNDYAEIGTIWIDQPNNDGYVLTSIVANQAQWIGIGGGAGAFTEIGVNTPAGAAGTIRSSSSITSLSGGIAAQGAGGSLTAATSVTAGTTVVATGDISSVAGNMSAFGTITAGGDITTANGDLTAGITTASTTPAALDFEKSRAGGVITSGDNLGIVQFKGYDGAAYTVGAAILATSLGTIGVNRVGASLAFYTHPDSTTATQLRFVVGADGEIAFRNVDGQSYARLTADSVGANADFVINAKGSGIVGQSRSLAAGNVALYNVNLDNTSATSHASIRTEVAGSSAGDAKVQVSISSGQIYSFGIDNSTASDDFVVSKNASLGTTNVLSFDGSTNAATFAAGVTVTTGGFVAATAGQGITLGNTAKVVDGTGDPSGVVTAPQGSLYLRRDGSSSSTRAYINTNGATAWTAITTAT